MTRRDIAVLRGLFVSEGSSDEPIAEIVEELFSAAGLRLNLSRPDYSRLEEKVAKDVRSRVLAGVELLGEVPDVVVAHRDADNVGAPARRGEIMEAISGVDASMSGVPVVPVRMTEAWLLPTRPPSAGSQEIPTGASASSSPVCARPSGSRTRRRCSERSWSSRPTPLAVNGSGW